MRTILARFWLINLAAGLTFSSMILNLRQDFRLGQHLELNQLLKQEATSFLGSYFWQKMDFYGHYGEWIEDREGDTVHYLSMFKAQKEFVPLIESSVTLDPTEVSRVTLFANTLGTSLDQLDKARTILQQSIIKSPQEMRIWRLYGELGLLYSQVANDCQTALRYYDKAMVFSRRHRLEDYNREDLMNRRFYGYYAASCLVSSGNPDKAFPFYMWSFFEKGNEEFEAALKPFRDALPKELHPSLPDIAPETGSEDHHHHHSVDCNHHSHQTDADMVPATAEERQEMMQQRLQASYDKMKERYMSVVPDYRSELIVPITWQAGHCFWLAGIFLSAIGFFGIQRL